MTYVNAMKAYELMQEVKLNEADMIILKDSINNDIEAAQITIQTKNGKYMSSLFKADRIELLRRVLYERNAELMKQLEEL